MHLLHVDSESNAHIIDKMIQDGKHVFILVYMVGCGPCNATKPEWKEMGETLQKQYKNNEELVIIDANKDFMPFIKMIGDVDGFPTLKYITNNGNTIQTYEDSDIRTKDRSSDSFINWVESKLLDGKIVSVLPDTSPHHVLRRLSQKSSLGQGKGISRRNKKSRRTNQSKRGRSRSRRSRK